jgi:uncharacterized protein YndB with AHSA1/START domain
MSAPTPEPTASLTVRKVLPCLPDEAFRAWTRPELFQQWFAPDPTMTTTAEMDLRPGGKYRIGFKPAGGEPAMKVGGEFLVIQAPHRLEYTWIWEKESDPDWRDRTVVKIDFKPMDGDRTEVVLTHEKFSSETSRDHHAHGWTAILDRMATAVHAKKS